MDRTAIALVRSGLVICFALAALGCDDEEQAPLIPDGGEAGASVFDGGETDAQAGHGGRAAAQGGNSEHGSADAAIAGQGAASGGRHGAIPGGHGGVPGSAAFGDGSEDEDAGASGSGGEGGEAGHASAAGSGHAAGGAGQAAAGSGGVAGSGHAAAGSGQGAAGGGGQAGAAGSGCPTTGCAPVCASCGECEQVFQVGSDTSHHSEPIDYKDPPPTWGPHNPCWTRWGVHDAQVPDERWVHNLEHGGVVFLYNCPDGCAAEVAMLSELVNESRRTVLTSYDLLPGRFAAVSWGHRLVASCFDVAALAQFYSHNFDHGAESLDDQPDPSCPP